MVTKQKPKPAPLQPLHSYVHAPAPKQQQQQQPLQPAPKATGGHYHAELTDAEAGDLLRRLVALDTDIRRYQQQIAEKRREQDMLLNQARLKIRTAFSTEPCSNCGFLTCVCERT